jgi:hypothetical protein
MAMARVKMSWLSTLIVITAFLLGLAITKGGASVSQSALAEEDTGKVPEERLVFQECEEGGVGYSSTIHRSKVPGGWLVVFTAHYEGIRPSITFYPDPKHEWDGTSLD